MALGPLLGPEWGCPLSTRLPHYQGREWRGEKERRLLLLLFLSAPAGSLSLLPCVWRPQALGCRQF